jgi:hypothetical protein
MKTNKHITPISPSEIINSLFPSLRTIVDNWEDLLSDLYLVKYNNWVAAVSDDSMFYEDEDERRFLEAVQRLGDSKIIAVSLSSWSLEADNTSIDRGFIIPTNYEAFEEFRLNGKFSSFSWYAIFPENLNWIVLHDSTRDFFIVLGEHDFVEQMLGTTREKAIQSIQDKADAGSESYFGTYTKQFYGDLAAQIRDAYPTAQPGEIIRWKTARDF